jgi:hypothetical protein
MALATSVTSARVGVDGNQGMKHLVATLPVY